MRTFPCRCGTDIEIIPPGPHAGYLVLDSDVDLSIDYRTSAIGIFLDAVRAGKRGEWLADFYGKNAPQSRFAEKNDADIIEDILSKLDSWTRQVLRRPICGRIYIQKHPGADEFRCYDEESSGPRANHAARI